MLVEVRLSTSFRKAAPGYDPHAGLSLELSQGETARNVIERLGIAPTEVKVVMINGKSAKLDSRLAQGDRVALFPAVGGG